MIEKVNQQTDFQLSRRQKWSRCAGPLQRIVDLCQWVFEEFRVAVSKQTMSRELRAMNYRKLSARPRHHAQAAGAIEDFKKVSPRAWRRSGAKPASIAAP